MTQIERYNCGTGAGGFKERNTCWKGVKKLKKQFDGIREKAKASEVQESNKKQDIKSNNTVRSDDSVQSKASVRINPDESVKVAESAAKHFGRQLEPHEWASLAGAPDHADVEVSGPQFYDPEGTVNVKWSVPGANCHNKIMTGDSGPDKGKTILSLETLFISPEFQGKGLGTKVFGDQIASAEKMGIGGIHLMAAGSATSKDTIGYYVWPRFGFDGPLESGHQRQLSRPFSRMKTIGQVMSTPEGRAEWKAKGSGIKVRFDAKPGSKSRERWDSYIQELSSKNG